MSRASRNKHAAPADSPTCKSIIGGFDLGTTNTVISVVEPDGKIKTIPNELGELTTPSAVFYDNDRILVGKSAIRASYKKPENFFRHIKPLMGSVDGNGNPIVIGFDPVNGKEITPITFSTNVLISLKGDCEKATGAKLKACTMGVPAYFTDTQREFTKLAGELAGLDVLKLVDEPIAAAIAYGLEKGQDMTLMVYDLGGGTFDCSIVRIQDGEVRVLDKSGDPKLGANDFLMRIVEFVLAAFKKEHGFELDPVDDAEDFLEILDRCEAGMKDLSVNETTLIACSGRGYRSKVELTRDGFNGLIHSCVLETHKHVQNALAKANLAPAGIDRVLLVGGGTRACLVQSMLEVLMGQKPCRDVDPDLCVSIGAAVVAHEMSQRDDAPKSVKEYGKMLPPAPFRTRDISSFPVSIVVVAKDHTTRVHSEMIKAGNPIPASVTDRFHPVGDYAMSVRIWVTQGKNGEPFSESQAVASFDLPIAPLPECEGGDRIEVTYSLDESGIVVVKAKDHVSGNVVEGKTATKVALKKETIDREKDALIRKIA